MPRVLLILALVATAFWVYTIVDCAVQPATRHRGVSKPMWVVIVIIFPVLGGILWLVVGRTRKAAMNRRSLAPDDDPEFLGRIGTISDQDERIRRLEEELAKLDAEDDGPPSAAPPHPDLEAPADGTAAAEPRGDDDDSRGPRGSLG